MKFYIAYSKKRRSVAEDTVENVDRRGFKSIAKDVAKEAAYNAASGALQRTVYGRRSMENGDEPFDRRDLLEDSELDRRGFKSVAKGVAKDVAKDAAYNAASGALQRTFNGRRSMEEEEELLEREFEDILDNLD